jgi:hypothetical protein
MRMRLADSAEDTMGMRSLSRALPEDTRERVASSTEPVLRKQTLACSLTLSDIAGYLHPYHK